MRRSSYLFASAIAVLGCGRIGFERAGDATELDTSVDAALGPFGTPVALTSVNSPTSSEDDPSFSTDLLELYFASDRPGLGGTDIWRSTRGSLDQPFGAPTLIPELSTTGSEGHPVLSSDALTIWISRGASIELSTRATKGSPWTNLMADPSLDIPGLSDKPGSLFDGDRQFVLEAGLNNRDIYVAQRASVGDPWGAATALAGLDTVAIEGAPSASASGLAVYFYSDRSGDLDLWVARRASLADPFGAPEPIAELNTTDSERDPHVSPDERVIVFSRGGELYMASR